VAAAGVLQGCNTAAGDAAVEASSAAGSEQLRLYDMPLPMAVIAMPPAAPPPAAAAPLRRCAAARPGPAVTGPPPTT